MLCTRKRNLFQLPLGTIHDETHQRKLFFSAIGFCGSAIDAHVVNSDVERNPGVARVEALHRHLGGFWRWTLYISIGALAYIYSLDQNTTSNYLPLATSSFGQHAFIGTIGTAEGIISELSFLLFIVS